MISKILPKQDQKAFSPTGCAINDKYGLMWMSAAVSSLKNQGHIVAGKSLSEALIFASTNPQYVDRLFIELQVQ